MKILIIITGLGMGGAERQVCDLADQFSILGHQVLIISMTGDNINKPISKSVEIKALNMKKTFLSFIFSYFNARKLIKEFNPDVVHSHMVHANIFARLLRIITPMPRLICTAHSSNEGGNIRIFAYRVTDFLCNITTNVSQDAVDSFIACSSAPSNRILAIHNGIDTTRFAFDKNARNRLRSDLGIPDSSPLLLAVGRLTSAKDYPNLLTAISLLTANHSDIQLVIIGAGEEESKLNELTAKLGLTKYVHFMGMRHDVNEWMSAADVFVLSSAWEGFGLVVAEAMACERIVVATDCGGVREVIGEIGLLVPPRQSDQLAKAISLAISMGSTDRMTIGERARRRIVEHYSLAAVVQHWLELYGLTK